MVSSIWSEFKNKGKNMIQMQIILISIRTKIHKITNQETQGIKSNTPEHLNKQPSLDITL